MDNERFLRLLNSGIQEDFNQLSEDIQRYAVYKARGLSDIDDVASGAWHKVVDLLIKGKSLDSWWHCKTIIDNYIKDLRRKTKAEGTILPSYVVYVSDLPKGSYPPKDDIYKLPEGNEKEICLRYWRDGLKQKEIANKLKLDKGYVSRIIKRHRTPPDTLVEYRYPKPPRKIKYAWDD